MWGKRREVQAAKAAEAAQATASLSVGQPETEAGSAIDAQAPGSGVLRQQAPATNVPANGAAAQAPSPVPDEKAQAFWRGKLATANFGGAVSLFLRSPAHRHYTLADLEWCLIPPLRLNHKQCLRESPSGC
jgi:hypothetical protein